LVVTREDLPTFDRTKYAAAAGTAKGAYVLADAADGKPEVLLLASGSTVPDCVAAYEKLKEEKIKARVVSMPSWEIFEYNCSKDPSYRETVLPASVKARVAVERASPMGWHKYVGMDGAVVGMRTFGASAPLKVLQKEFGFTTENIVAEAKEQLKKHKR
jgi:transketolase